MLDPIYRDFAVEQAVKLTGFLRYALFEEPVSGGSPMITITYVLDDSRPPSGCWRHFGPLAARPTLPPRAAYWPVWAVRTPIMR